MIFEKFELKQFEGKVGGENMDIISFCISLVVKGKRELQLEENMRWKKFKS